MIASQQLADHFDERYRVDPDPWGYRTRWMERRRHALMLSLLGRERYERAFEPACGSGAFTQLLARRCDELVAWDASPVAATLAAAALGDDRDARSQGVTSVGHGVVPDEWPSGSFGLIVIADFAYYLDRYRLAYLAERVIESLEQKAEILAVHWRGSADDFQADAFELHDLLRCSPLLESCCIVQDESMILDLYRRRP